jgi:hypothetical protein
MPLRPRVAGAPEQALSWLIVLAAGAAWVYVLATIAALGIGNRPSLIVAQVCAILLSPVAIALFGRR